MVIMASYISHPLLKKNAIESRLYQQVLAGDVLKKGNTMVVAPTALGKTIVAILVAADRLQKVKNSKVLVLAPSKPLADFMSSETRFQVVNKMNPARYEELQEKAQKNVNDKHTLLEYMSQYK